MSIYDDNVRKNDDKDRQRRQGQAKICSRLLPRAAVGIYRNGAKGKDIQKETSENTFHRARLKADALKLFNGDTPEFKKTYIEKLSTHDETSKQSPNKNFVKNSLKFWTPDSILEESPILGERQSKNQKPQHVKKKNEDIYFEKLDFDKIRKQNINRESKYIAQKENIHQQKLFQNDKEQSEVTTVTQTQLYDNGNLMEKNRIDENRTEEALNQYKELCKMISVVNFGDLQIHQPDPLTTIIEKLRRTNSLCQQLRKMNELKIGKSSELPVGNQACTYSNISQMLPNSTSTIEYEVRKYNENRRISPVLLENIPEEDDKIYLMQSDNIEACDSISQNISEICDTNDCIIEKYKNNDKQYSKQSADIHQSTRAANLYAVNKKGNRKKHFNYLKNKRHNRNNFNADFFDYEHSQCIDNMKHTKISTFSSDSMLLADKYSSTDACKKSSTDFSNKITNKCNAKNIKRPVIRRNNNVTAVKDHSVQKHNEDLFHKKSYVEKVYEQFGININHKNLDNKRHPYVDSFRQQLLRKKNKRELETVKTPLSVEYQACTYSDASQVSPHTYNSTSICEIDCEIPKYRENHTNALPLIEGIFQKRNKFHLMQSNIAPYNDITKESYKMQFSNASENFPTPSIINAQFANVPDRIKTFEPEIGLMEMQDSQESLVEKFDINLHPKKLDRRNGLCRFDSSLSTFETLYNINNTYSKQLAEEEKQVLPKMKKHPSNSHNYAINYLQDASPCTFNIKSTKPLSQQIKLHICESNDAKQELLEKRSNDWNQNVFFNNVNKTRVIPSSTLNLSQNIQTNKRFREPTYKEIFSNANIECSKNQDNLSNCNTQYIYLDSTRCQHKYNISQAHRFHNGAVQTMIQPGILHEDYNSNMDNCINLSNDVPLSLDQNYTTYTYPKVDNQHRSVLLQNITQPIKYLAVNNNSDIQRIPVYINDKNVIQDDPVKVITLIKPNIQKEELYFHKNYNLRRK
ncbi:uncharacterized protein [Anoplolepis gracilipes]|uniref:uncharacterized protein isoform X2 n=1 Tax=Anoplolepis gracilipes TaxID=354296 RepID=UPI003BA1D09D